MRKAKAKSIRAAKAKKKRRPKKIRAWYSSYKERCRALEKEPWEIQVWAAVEAERSTGARRKELARFLTGSGLL